MGILCRRGVTHDGVPLRVAQALRSTSHSLRQHVSAHPRPAGLTSNVSRGTLQAYSKSGLVK